MSKGFPYGLILAAPLLALGCNPNASDNQSAVFLSASFGGASGSAQTAGLLVDVVNSDGTTSDDTLNLHVESTPKAGGGSPSTLYTVHYEGVEISYSRVDGHNQPGVDVPFPIRYAIGGTVAPGGTSDVELIVVTKEMKVQPRFATSGSVRGSASSRRSRRPSSGTTR